MAKYIKKANDILLGGNTSTVGVGIPEPTADGNNVRTKSGSTLSWSQTEIVSTSEKATWNGKMDSANTTSSTFDGSNIILDLPDKYYGKINVTNNNNLNVSVNNNKISAGAIIVLIGNGTNQREIVGAELADNSTFDIRNNYCTPVLFFNRGDKVMYRYDTSYLNTSIAPSITAQPSSTGVTEGSTATFNIVAAGSTPLSYQWYRNGTLISGATSAGYTTAATTITGDNGATFYCIVTNDFGTVSSNTVTLTVSVAGVAPSITSQPVNANANQTDVVIFSITASSSTPITYQWQISTNSGSTWANIIGETSMTYSRTILTTDNNYLFRCVATNTSGSTNSNSALLIVSQMILSFWLAEDRAKYYILADRTLNSSPISTGITLSGGKTTTSIVRGINNTNLYIGTLSSPYTYTDSPTITLANSSVVAADTTVNYATINKTLSYVFALSANVIESPSLTFKSNSASTWLANAIGSIPLIGDFTYQIDIASSFGRGAVIGVKSTNTISGFNASFLYYCLINTGANNDVIGGKDGVNNTLILGSFATATDTKLRLRRVSGVFTVQVLRSGTWTTIYTLSGTNTSTLYPAFSIIDNTIASNSLVNPVITNA